MTGFEPAQDCSHMDLNHTCLPFHHIREFVAIQAHLMASPTNVGVPFIIAWLLLFACKFYTKIFGEVRLRSQNFFVCVHYQIKLFLQGLGSHARQSLLLQNGSPLLIASSLICARYSASLHRALHALGSVSISPHPRVRRNASLPSNF